LTDVVVSPQEPTGPATPSGPSLSHLSARGLAWMSVNSLVSKVLGTLSQIILAWLLLPKDFGLIGLTYTVAAVTGILANTGLEDVLLQRQKHFHRWANPAFWISLFSGCVATVVMILAAPIAARVYHERAMLGLTLAMSMGFPLANASLVPLAKLRIDLRFRTLAVLGMLNNALLPLLTILFAWGGYAAYSFIWPRLICAALTAGAAWYLTRAVIKPRLELHLWRRLLGVGAATFGTRITFLLVTNGDYLTLGLMYPAAVVGAYFFAFNLSTQTTALVVVNFNNVLFPALCKLQADVNRQARAMLRGLRMLATIAVPCCFLQAALAGPGIHVLFQPKWYPAIPVLQVLSIGMAFSALAWPAASLLPAQGRFSVQAVMAWISCVLFFILVGIGAYLYGNVGAGAGVAIYWAIYSLSNLRISLSPTDFGWREIFDSIKGSFIGGAIAVGIASAARMLLPSSFRNGWITIVLVTSLSVYLYRLYVRRMDPEAWQELVHRAGQLRAKLIRINPLSRAKHVNHIPQAPRDVS
jgi:O-antigen/teichoic acid export membrane protein